MSSLSRQNVFWPLGLAIVYTGVSMFIAARGNALYCFNVHIASDVLGALHAIQLGSFSPAKSLGDGKIKNLSLLREIPYWVFS